MKKIRTDIIVCGAGSAGLAAAVEAAEKGAKVVLLEKRASAGGASNAPVMISGMPKDQSWIDRAFNIHMEGTHWKANADLVRTWMNISTEMPDWMSAHDIPFSPIPSKLTAETLGQEMDELGGFPKFYNTGIYWFLHPEGKGHGGAVLIKRLMSKAKELGVEVLMSTPAYKILKNGDKVAGVLARTPDGKDLQVEADAVIICTAGFNEDPEMLKKYSGYNFTPDRNGDCLEGDLFFLWPDQKLTGDGIKMAWEAGADKGAMGIPPFPHVPGPGIIGHLPWDMKSQLRIIQEQPYLWVNKQGKRFINELMMTDHITSGMRLAKQIGKCAYMIFDEDTKNLMEQKLDYIYFVFPAEKLVNIDGDFANLQAQGNKHVFIAETLKDLCEQAGIDFDGLSETIEEYNGYCDSGRDDQYAKKPDFLHPVRNGKLYAIRVYSTTYQTIGGVKVNGKCQVLTREEKVIPGLYAAGDLTVAELFGDPPTAGCGQIGFAVSAGLAASRDALKFIRKVKR